MANLNVKIINNQTYQYPTILGNTWGLTATEIENYSQFVGEKNNFTRTVNGFECETYAFVRQVSLTPPDKAIAFYSQTGRYYKTVESLKFQPEGFGLTGDQYITPQHSPLYWFVYNDKWFLLCQEVPQTIYLYTDHSLTYEPTNVEIYQPFDFSISGTVVKHVIIIASDSATETTEDVSFSSFSELDQVLDIDDTLLNTNNILTTVGMHTYKPKSWMSGNFEITIEVQDYNTKFYAIEEYDTTYKIYAGKEVGEDFLSHFKLVYVEKNDYNEVKTVIHTVLEKEKLSKTIWTVDDTLISFTYSYEDQLIEFSGESNIVGLAAEPDRYAAMSVKTSYLRGETFDSSTIDIKNSGYLTYSDGSTISLNDVVYLQEPTVTSSLGNNFDIDDNTGDFTVTYTMHTRDFGSIIYSFTAYVTGQTEDYVTEVKLVGAKINFTANEIIEFGSDATLELYNAYGELIETITYDNFSQYISSYSTYYGKTITSDLYLDELSLTFIYKGRIEFTWSITIDYDEESLIIETSNVKTKYYVGGDYTFELDIAGLVVKKQSHLNSVEIGHIETAMIDSDLKFTHSDVNVVTGSKKYAVTVNHTNAYAQVLTGTYEITVVAYEPIKMEIEGTVEPLSSAYWNNDKDTFHLPEGIVFNRIYSDGTYIQITDFNELKFYRDSNHVNRLIIGESVIRVSDGDVIYVEDTITGTKGSYGITFKKDTIKSIALGKEINFVLGNYLEDYRSEFEVIATYDSGETSTITNFKFDNVNLIIESTPVSLIINDISFTIEGITFVNPEIKAIEVDYSKFSTTYNNLSDGINASTLKLKVSYENSRFIQECNVLKDEVIEYNNEFVVSSTLTDFKFDGSTKLNLDMGQNFSQIVPLTITVRNSFDSSKTASTTLNVLVIEILEVTGIKLVSVYTDYHVNDTFLNENDDTIIQIFYKDTDGNQKWLQIPLISDFSAINIYPLKGTKFYTINNNVPVRVSSATNANVYCEYSIEVNATYIYSNTQTHNLVAVYVSEFTKPNGEVETNKYILVDKSVTEIDSTGTRIFSIGNTINNVKIYGYLEDVFDVNKNARVILFEDYVPPVEGANNITVKFPCYSEENAQIIDKCRFGIMFGNNNAKNRLFLSGNEDIPNCDWHSGQVSNSHLSDESMVKGNFAYFEDTSYCYYGETDNSVIGYDIVSNDRLLVLKDKSDKETTVYFRTPVLVSAIDGGGNAMTGINGETLYQEEFSLVKGNNSVAGVSPKSIVNFNGDTVFLSSERNLVGLDLTGIIGDNQRYANSRSRYIDEDLRSYDMNKSWLWTNNKYLFIVLEDKIFITHYETRSETQYEWWVVNIKDIQSIVERDEHLYFADSQGRLYELSKEYSDKEKIFIGYGGALASLGVGEDKVYVSNEVISQLDDDKKYTFKIIPNGANLDSYMYYQLGIASNEKVGTFDFYVDKETNCLEVLGYVNGKMNIDRISEIEQRITCKKDIYLNYIQGRDNLIETLPTTSVLSQYYKRYKLVPYVSDEYFFKGSLYKLVDAVTEEEMNVTELLRATLCYRLDEEYDVVEIDRETSSFKLMYNGQMIDLVKYNGQTISYEFKAEIIRRVPVEAYYITKPFTLGSLDYFKTIWSWTLTNDTNIPSELEVGIASNKIPKDSIKTLAKIGSSQFSCNLDELNFGALDLDKNLVPRTYTNARVLSHVKYVCFAFKNYNDTNSVLSSMSIVYTTPFPSYGGD